MDIRSNNAARPDVVSVESTARPTPTPARVPFKQILTKGAAGLAQGAEAALRVLPGGPMIATALRSTAGASGYGTASPTGGRAAEGPGAAGTGAGGEANPNGGIESAVSQAQDDNLYYLGLQMRMQQMNQHFTTLSNVLKAEHDTAKNAIGNVR